jgi:hypothetical protein
MPALLSDSLIELIESGVGIEVGTRDQQNVPEAQPALGAKVNHREATITLFLQAPLAARTRTNVEANGLVAVTFSRILDSFSVQLKGTARVVGEASAEHHAIAERYLVAFAEQLSIVGVPRSVTRRIRLRPGLVLEFTPLEVFQQTPGAGAGRRVEAL